MREDKVIVKCAAKINLYLAVTGKREDGFHDIETIFQPVSLYDHIAISYIESGIELRGNDSSIPWDESNLCFRAAYELSRSVPFDGGVRIAVEKSIPAGAGLGGGSSDAAGVLAGMNAYFNLGLERGRLMEIALRLGSDVPFFLFGGPAIGRGRGEILEATDGLTDVSILIVFPGVVISTAEAFKKLNLMLTKSESGIKLGRLLDELNRSPRSKVLTFNSFQNRMREHYRGIDEVLGFFEREGKTSLFSLSGSGSACFGIFNNRGEALQMLNHVKGKGYSGFVVEPVNRAIKIC